MLCEQIQTINDEVPLLLTIPHSGEQVPAEAPWLHDLPKETFLRDIDRFVDELYLPAIRELKVPTILTRVHRYAADLNRYPNDIDSDSVIGAPNPSGTFTHGFHWVKSTQSEPVMKKPIDPSTHDSIVREHHDRFHSLIATTIQGIRRNFGNSQPIFHFDLHSMPSRGTGAHADQGRTRAEVVLSDFEGKSCSPLFLKWTLAAFKKEDFEVAVNWPYKGGRITQRYGKPDQGHHTLQIELNRSLYLDEQTREKLGSFEFLQVRLGRVLARIMQEIKTASATSSGRH
jgi:N-formylglutamate deformylase